MWLQSPVCMPTMAEGVRLGAPWVPQAEGTGSLWLRPSGWGHHGNPRLRGPGHGWQRGPAVLFVILMVVWRTEGTPNAWGILAKRWGAQDADPTKITQHPIDQAKKSDPTSLGGATAAGAPSTGALPTGTGSVLALACRGSGCLFGRCSTSNALRDHVP